MDDSTPGVSHSIWSHPHFVMAVIAQFLYVAAQAGIFSFFINYVTSQVPEIPSTLDAAVQNSPDFLKHWLNSLTEIRTTGAVAFSNKGASNLVSVGLLSFPGGPVHRHCSPEENSLPTNFWVSMAPSIRCSVC